MLLFNDTQMIPIGLADTWDQRSDGLWGRFRIALTSPAQQAAAVARDGYLTGMSVGFQPEQSTWEYPTVWDPATGQLDRVTRMRARLLEVSLTPVPVFTGAMVTDVEARALSPTARPQLRQAQSWARAMTHLTREDRLAVRMNRQ